MFADMSDDRGRSADKDRIKTAWDSNGWQFFWAGLAAAFVILFIYYLVRGQQ